MDVLEEVGDDVARRCYWDFGDWSDLWRDTKHVPTGVHLQVSSAQGLSEIGCLCSYSLCPLTSLTDASQLLEYEVVWGHGNCCNLAVLTL